MIAAREYAAQITSTSPEDKRGDAFATEAEPILAEYLALNLPRSEMASQLFEIALRLGVASRVNWDALGLAEPVPEEVTT